MYIIFLLPIIKLFGFEHNAGFESCAISHIVTRMVMFSWLAVSWRC